MQHHHGLTVRLAEPMGRQGSCLAALGTRRSSSPQCRPAAGVCCHAVSVATVVMCAASAAGGSLASNTDGGR